MARERYFKTAEGGALKQRPHSRAVGCAAVLIY
jgi:hypothetical protein